MEKDDDFDLVNNEKAKSKVWNQFQLKKRKSTGQIQDGVAVCKKCKMDIRYSGGTTNLNTHLTRHHKLILQPGASQSSPITSVETAAVAKQPSIMSAFGQTSKYKPSSKRYKDITQVVGKFIIKDLRPFSVVSNEGFKDMVRILDHKYELPSRTYFSETVIPNMYNDRVAYVKSCLKGANVALTTDGWTSRSTQSYVTVTCSHITEDWTLKSYVLQTRELPESHTGKNIAKVLEDAISEWGIQKSPPLVTDNAANMGVAAKESGCTPHIGCYAHTLNLAAQKALKVATVSRILGRVRRVVSFFHRSTTAAALLKVKTQQLVLKNVKLIQDVSTRWNSAADMLQRFIELQPAIYASLIEKSVRANASDISTLSDADVTTAEQIMACLLPLKAITTVLCSETMPTVSIILPLQTKLLSHDLISNESDTEIINQMKQAMRYDLGNRYQSIHEFLQECTVLDPRFKASCLTPQESFDTYHRVCMQAANRPVQVKVEPATNSAPPASSDPSVSQTPPLPDVPILSELVSSIDLQPSVPVSDVITATSNQSASQPFTSESSGLASILGDVIFVREDRTNIKSNMERASVEVDNFKIEPLLSMSSDALVWWKSNHWKFPLLSSLARKRLCIPATSVPSECVFSTAGDIVTAQRAALSPEVVDMLIFLKKNID